MMDVTEAKKRKAEFAQEIAKRVREFQDETGLTIQRIHLDRLDVSTCSSEPLTGEWITVVRIEVSL